MVIGVIVMSSIVQASTTVEKWRKNKVQPVAGSILADHMRTKMLQIFPEVPENLTIKYPQAKEDHPNKLAIAEIAEDIYVDGSMTPEFNGYAYYFPLKVKSPEYANALVLMNLENEAPSPKLLEDWKRLKKRNFIDIQNYKDAKTEKIDEETGTKSITCGVCNGK